MGALAPGELERVACLVCGADEPRPAFTAEETRAGVGGAFAYVACGACGLTYLSPRPTAAALGRFYPPSYYATRPGGERVVRHQGRLRTRAIQAALEDHLGYPPPDGRRAPWWRRLLTWPLARRLRRARRHADALPWVGRGRLLDFGIGRGAFLRLQRQRGWTVAGLDLDPEVVRRAREEDGVEAEVGTWPGPAFAGRAFDAITAWHVLEHLPDPRGFVAAAAERLAPGGELVLACPSAGSWSFAWFGPAWLDVDAPRHLALYRPGDLRRLVEGAGLEWRGARQQARPASFRQSARDRAARTGSLVWRLLAELRPLWSLVARLAAWRGRADVVIARARKPGEAGGPGG